MGLLDFFKSKKIKKTTSSKSSDFEKKYPCGVCEIPLDAEYTPESIKTLGRREIFVFGSNLAGKHAGGAARVALNRFGAVWGQGEGLQGNSYAIPTMQGGIDTIKPYVDRFIEFAEYEKALTFYVTKIGCGIAGFAIKDIAPLFRNAYNLSNVILPIEFVDYIEKENRSIHPQRFVDYIENENRSIHPQRILETMEAAHEARVKHYETPIKIIGIGGGGCNAVSRMLENPYRDAEYAFISNDATMIRTSKVSNQYLLQDSDPCTAKNIYTQEQFNHYFIDRGDNAELLRSIIDDTVKQLIIVSGFGGGFGTYCCKWFASIAKHANIPTTVVCTIPFEFEGQRKQQRAIDAANELSEEGIAVKILKADTLKRRYSDMSLFDCFSLLDEYVADTVHEICKELPITYKSEKQPGTYVNDRNSYEVTTHCYGMTRTFADIILGLNEEKKYTSPGQALSDLGSYMQRFSEQGDNIAFLSVRILQCILHDGSDIFTNGHLNVLRLRELVFEDKNFLSAYDKAYDSYCREKLINLVAYLNEFRRYSTPEELRRDLFENTDVFEFSACAPIPGFYYFIMSGVSAMNYPVQFFVRAIRNLWPEITTDGVLDADKMRRLMFGNHDESVEQLGLEATIQRDYIADSPCHPEVFVPKVMGTAPIYVKDVKTGRYMRSCGEGKGPNSIPDWLEFQIAKQILEKDESYQFIGNYYIPKNDYTLPVYGGYSGRLVFETQNEKLKFIEDIKSGKQVWR